MSERPAVSTARTGVVVLATAFILLAGFFNLISGVAAIADDQRFVTDELLFGNLTLWGVFWLLFGGLQLFVGVLLFQRKPAGAVLGIAIAILNASLHLMFVGAYPIWSLTIIAVDAVVIWALTTHPAFEDTPVQR
jgi:hypothetical protein